MGGNRRQSPDPYSYLKARLEMFAAGYTTAKPLAARIFDRVRPLPGELVKPLEKFSSNSPSKDGTLL